MLNIYPGASATKEYGFFRSTSGQHWMAGPTPSGYAGAGSGGSAFSRNLPGVRYRSARTTFSRRFAVGLSPCRTPSADRRTSAGSLC